MSDALDRLIVAQGELIAALDGDDAGAIEMALVGFRDGLSAVQAIGRNGIGDDAKARLSEALALAEAARIRTNYLADRTRRQIGRLTELGRGDGAIAYDRRGRVRA